ncbi:hypothetical protein GF352_02625 [archaeon]|nr:hypothetical protein [archaeon]
MGEELIPERVTSELKEIFDPVSPEATDSVIKFLVSELKSMFRELSEMRSAEEDDAREVLSRHEVGVLKKLEELFPEYPSRVQDAFALMTGVIEDKFERQRGMKYL